MKIEVTSWNLKKYRQHKHTPLPSLPGSLLFTWLQAYSRHCHLIWHHETQMKKKGWPAVRGLVSIETYVLMMPCFRCRFFSLRRLGIHINYISRPPHKIFKQQRRINTWGKIQTNKLRVCLALFSPSLPAFVFFLITGVAPPGLWAIIFKRQNCQKPNRNLNPTFTHYHKNEIARLALPPSSSSPPSSCYSSSQLVRMRISI